MKARLKTRITIKAKPASIFKYLGHTKYHLLWNPQMQSVTPTTQLKEGSVYTAQSMVLGVRIKAENHVTKYVQDEQLGLQNTTGTVQYAAQFQLTTVGDATLVTCTIAVSAEGRAFVFAKPMLEQLARRELHADLKALKEAVEQKLQP
ncbi:MAG: SRPBCC family protein [Candidatus Saccharimonadales bacterium]